MDRIAMRHILRRASVCACSVVLACSAEGAPDDARSLAEIYGTIPGQLLDERREAVLICLDRNGIDTSRLDSRVTSSSALGPEENASYGLSFDLSPTGEIEGYGIAIEVVKLLSRHATPSDRDTSSADAVAADPRLEQLREECEEEAAAQLPAPTLPVEMKRSLAEDVRAFMVGPDMTHASLAWTDCMSQRGWRFDSPIEARQALALVANDTAEAFGVTIAYAAEIPGWAPDTDMIASEEVFGGTAPPTTPDGVLELERSVAQDDHACGEETNYYSVFRTGIEQVEQSVVNDT